MFKQLQAIFSKKYAQKWIVALLTAVGAFGGFPPAPKFIQRSSILPAFQFVALFVLVLQGGGGMDFGFSLVVTGTVFLALKIIEMVENKQEESKIE